LRIDCWCMLSKDFQQQKAEETGSKEYDDISFLLTKVRDESDE
jgi:hypothetical protein